MPTEWHKDLTEADWLAMRLKDVTSTDVAALFGASPWVTKYELWHRKKESRGDSIEESERMKWGNVLEPAIAAEVAKIHNIKIRPMKEYGRNAELRIGASFDACTIPGEDIIVECKNVDGLVFRDQWEKDGDTYEAPVHIELQCQHQLLVAEKKKLIIGALVGGNRLITIERELDIGIQARILEEVAKFWDSIKKGEEPEPDFQRDAEFIAELYDHAEPGKLMKSTPELDEIVIQHMEAHADLKQAGNRKQELKAQALILIGEHEKVKGDWGSINAGVRGEALVPAYLRKGYRNFAVYPKKKRKEDSNE